MLKLDVLGHQAGRLHMADPAAHDFMDEVVGRARLHLACNGAFKQLLADPWASHCLTSLHVHEGAARRYSMGAQGEMLPRCPIFRSPHLLLTRSYGQRRIWQCHSLSDSKRP